MFLKKTNRKIIPRWRDFLTTITLGELYSLNHPNAAPYDSENRLDAFRQSWTVNRTLWHALDFIGAALVLARQNESDVKAAAQFVVEHADTSPASGLNLARMILNPELDVTTAPEAVEQELDQTRSKIHVARLRLRDDPRNSVGMVDLARLYTIVGHFEKAKFYVELAYKQSPNNRFVLRSAARFFLHLKDTDRALTLLRSSELLTSDPWVSAAEIGVASIAGRAPRSVKVAARLLDRDDLRLTATSELASALGTLELNNDRQGPARRLFKRSLQAPTENSLAQAEWASNLVAGLNVNVATSLLPRTFEAKTIHGFSQGNWDMARENCIQWLRDQPFSSRPASVVSYIYDTIYEDYAESEKILQASLISNPGDRELLNNLAFSLACQGKLDKAEDCLKVAHSESAKDPSTIALCATLGLVHFRRKYYETGRTLYLEAMNLARQANEGRYEAMAALNLAREEFRAHRPTRAATAQHALQLAKKFKEPDLQFVASRIQNMAQIDAGLSDK